jgi:hypothetical protein
MHSWPYKVHSDDTLFRRAASELRPDARDCCDYDTRWLAHAKQTAHYEPLADQSILVPVDVRQRE